MKLTSFPGDYPSPLVDNPFIFDEVDTSHPTEIAFWLEGEQQNTLLGLKRFVGQTTIRTSPASYLQRHLSPEPHQEQICRFVYPQGRNLRAFLRWGTEGEHRSAIVGYTSANRNLSAPAVLGADHNLRSIAPGECDEVLFLVGETTPMSMRMLLPNGQVVGINQNSGSRAGLWVLCVDIAWVLSRLEQPHSIKEFTLELYISGSLAATIHYDIVARTSSAVRLGWLTPEGAIGYHTFNGIPEGRTLVERTGVDSATEGTIVVGVRGRQQLRLRSGVVDPTVHAHLSTLVTSPLVWRIEPDGSFSRVAILSAEATTYVKQPNSLEVVIAPQQSTTYW